MDAAWAQAKLRELVYDTSWKPIDETGSGWAAPRSSRRVYPLSSTGLHDATQSERRLRPDGRRPRLVP